MKGLEALQRELEERKLLEHLHNLRFKALSRFSKDFLNSAKHAIPLDYAPLLLDRRSLTDFAVRLRALNEQQQEALVAAAQPFCDRYGLVSGFWIQQGALDDLIARSGRKFGER